MKVKVVLGALLATATTAQGVAVAAEQVHSDGTTSGRVVYSYTGNAAKKFIPRQIEMYKATLSDPMASKEVKAATKASMDMLLSGNYQSYTFSQSIPSGDASPLSPDDIVPGNCPIVGKPGQTCTSGLCGTGNNGYLQDTETVYEWEPSVAGGNQYSWVAVSTSTKQVTTCPGAVA